MNTPSPEYIRYHGSLCLKIGETIHPPVERELGVLYDDASGVLHKHGEAYRLEAHFFKMRMASSAFPEIEPELLRIPVANVTPAVLEEINACLACSGRVKGLKDRLSQLALPAA